MSKHRDAFAAIADPTRRAILDLLRQRPSLTAGEIAAQFPHMSRPAISKHLGVLRRARLVQALERGREWHYSLDPLPLGEIYTDWLAGFAPLWETSLKQLKRQAEQQRPGRSLAESTGTSADGGLQTSHAAPSRPSASGCADRRHAE